MQSLEQAPTRTDSTPAEADRVAATLELLFRLTRRVSPVGEFSLTCYLVLARLTRDGAARVTELADFEGVTQPTMTQIATRLRNAGLIEQISDPSDGRAMLLSITPARSPSCSPVTSSSPSLRCCSPAGY